jgi:hypothetical protein
MDITARPYVSAGFAVTLVAAAGLIAAPVVAPLPGLPDLQTRDVQLVDVSWDQVLQTALANATDINDHFSPAPFVDLQQFAANLPDYLDGTRNFETDLTTAYNAAITPFIPPAGAEPYIYTSVDPTHSEIDISALGIHLFDIPLPGKDGLIDILTNGLSFDIGICPGLLCTDVTIPVLPLLVGDQLATEITPYLEFSGSPLSGILWGSFGTTFGPLLQLNDDVTAITTALSGSSPDYTTAFNDLLDMPANVTNAFLNGYGDISLDTLLTDFGIASPSTDATLTLDLGGLLSPAGSLINGIGFTDTLGDCSIACATLDVPSTMVGPIASLILEDQAIAESIGWDGVGSPLANLFGELTSMF